MVSIQTIKRQSSKAICGAFEMQVVVDSDEVAEVKRELRANGFMIVGTGDHGFGKTVIWYNPLGVNL